MSKYKEQMTNKQENELRVPVETRLVSGDEWFANLATLIKTGYLKFREPVQYVQQDYSGVWNESGTKVNYELDDHCVSDAIEDINSRLWRS